MHKGRHSTMKQHIKHQLVGTMAKQTDHTQEGRRDKLLSLNRGSPASTEWHSAQERGSYHYPCWQSADAPSLQNWVDSHASRAPVQWHSHAQTRRSCALVLRITNNKNSQSKDITISILLHMRHSSLIVQVKHLNKTWNKLKEKIKFSFFIPILSTIHTRHEKIRKPCLAHQKAPTKLVISDLVLAAIGWQLLHSTFQLNLTLL